MDSRLERSGFSRVVSAASIVLLVGIGSIALAQAPAPLPTPVTSSAQPAQPLSPQQLDDLVAPVALYPDPLLGQVLAASTYPLELVEAKQWVQQNPTLQGQALTDAARNQPWDASVQALVAMPDALNRMTENVQWTTALGNAFLSQQADVMAAVQRMRVSAEKNGKLQSSSQATVTTEDQDGQSAVEIEPASPDVIYVPSYDPEYIWGPPMWGYYPPLYYPSYGFWWGPGINVGLCFGGWGGWGFGWGGGFGWGWGLNWWGHGLFVNHAFFSHYGYHYGYGFDRGFGGVGGRFAGTTAWAHDPGHRLGVGYANAGLNARYGAASMASRAAMTPRAARDTAGWARFGQSGAANSFRGASPQTGARTAQGSAGWQRFSNAGRATAQNGRAPAQSYRAPAQSYRSPAQSYRAPAQSYRAPAQSYRAPAQSYRPPSMSNPGYRSAPSFGGGARSFGGGSSGGGARSFGGGGGFHGGGGGVSRGGGGGHGGGRR
ncbi:MAG TPA: DUF3300 domain-containing protein [Bryobacteraceae bacterium]|nr:DUF3300 domain-containing protein [Bryobacteraceae bacterium]